VLRRLPRSLWGDAFVSAGELLETIRAHRYAARATWRGSAADAGGGVDDLVLHFDVAALRANGDLTAATTSLTLNATLTDARRFRGVVAVRVVG
jgi:hypothetical protein